MNYNNITEIIEALDEDFLNSDESTNYGEMLISLPSSNSLESMIKNFINVLEGIEEDPYYITLNDDKDILIAYLNECILSKYKESDSNSIDEFYKYYVNIHKQSNTRKIREEIVSLARIRGLEVEDKVREINSLLEEYNKETKEMNKYNYGTNGYNLHHSKCLALAKKLQNYHYMPLRSYDMIFEELKEKEEKRVKRLKEREKAKKEERQNIISGIISSIIIIALIILIPSDMMPWIIAILFILLLLKKGL